MAAPEGSVSMVNIDRLIESLELGAKELKELVEGAGELHEGRLHAALREIDSEMWSLIDAIEDDTEGYYETKGA